MLSVLEGIQLVATFASIIFRVDVVNQMAAPTGGTVRAIIDLDDGTDVITTIMPTVTVTIEDTTFVKFSAVGNFTAGRRYSMQFSFTDGTNILPGEILMDAKF